MGRNAVIFQKIQIIWTWTHLFKCTNWLIFETKLSVLTKKNLSGRNCSCPKKCQTIQMLLNSFLTNYIKCTSNHDSFQQQKSRSNSRSTSHSFLNTTIWTKGNHFGTPGSCLENPNTVQTRFGRYSHWPKCKSYCHQFYYFLLAFECTMQSIPTETKRPKFKTLEVRWHWTVSNGYFTTHLNVFEQPFENKISQSLFPHHFHTT